jgi:hypothetical protein
MNEVRLVDRLTAFWNNTRKDAVMPDFAQFNSASIDDIWQQCVLFTVQPTVEGKPPSLSFYQVGDKVRSIYGQDMTGQIFNPAQRHFQGAMIVRKATELIANPVPIVDMGQFINASNTVIKYRSCLLPFGSGGKVTHIIAGLSWRAF